MQEVISTLIILSAVFSNGDRIPSKYTCDGEDVSPPLEIKQIPEEAKSLAIIVDDPDAPNGTWVHWVMWNIPVDKKVMIKEGEVPGVEGINSFDKYHYGGPCPPSGKHRYFFKVYALDTMFDLDKKTDKEGLKDAMNGHVLSVGKLMGEYSRQ